MSYAFSGWLVGLDHYSQVELTFGEPGHTGNPVDSLFKSLSVVFGRGVSCLYDLLHQLRQSAPQPSQFVLIDGVHDWKHFFKDYLPGIVGQSQGKHFLIQKEDGVITVRAKERVSLASQWGPPVCALSGIPPGLPPPLPNSLDPVFSQVELGLRSLLQSHLLPPLAKPWFQNVLDKKEMGFEIDASVRRPGIVGEVGTLSLGGPATQPLIVSVIRAEYPAPTSLPEPLISYWKSQDPAFLYAQRPKVVQEGRSIRG